MWYVGIDYHLEIAVVCIMGPTGKVKEKFEVSADPTGMDTVIGKMNGKKYRVLGEAFTYSMDLHNHLLSKGVMSDLVQPDQLQIITKSYKKTDYHDCEAIAWYLRMSDKKEIALPMSYIVKDDEMRLRDLCRLRDSMSSEMAALNQQMQAHMRRNGEYLPKDVLGEDPDINTIKVQKYIMTTFDSDFTLQEYLRLYIIFRERSKMVDTELTAFEVDENMKKLLVSIPGIGDLTAVMLISMIIDVRRFRSADAMRSFYGMAPKVRDSGETVKHGRITKKGDRMMRDILKRATFVHMRCCPESPVKRTFESVSSRSKKPIAVTAAANKLLDIIYAVLVSGVPFHC